MPRRSAFFIFFILCSLIFAPATRAEFDERYWENYAEIEMPASGELPALGGIEIHSWSFKNSAHRGFSDIRILDANKTEIPYQILTDMPETRTEELAAKILNLSLTKDNETFFTCLIEKENPVYNTIEIKTEDSNFYRKVKILGSASGQNWKLLRGEAIIFDYEMEDRLRHLRITFPDSSFKYLAVEIINGPDKPLTIKGLKIFNQKTGKGSSEQVYSGISRNQVDTDRKETVLELGLPSRFPVREATLLTVEKNFQRRVEVYIPAQDERSPGGWVKWADGMVFNIMADKAKEENLSISFPEVSAGKIKLVIKNYDSPPLKIDGVNFSGYKKLLAFKLNGRGKYFVFWGNPQARAPQYDISGLVSKYDISGIRTFPIGPEKKNPTFTGAEKRLPFTERYKHLLYVIVSLLITGLVFFQFRLMRKSGK